MRYLPAVRGFLRLSNPHAEHYWLYASMVGLDTVLSSNTVANGYAVPAGVAAGDFLQNLAISELSFPAIPHSATVRAGASITLSAAAATTGSPLGYQWQLSGSSLDGATEASLLRSEERRVGKECRS